MHNHDTLLLDLFAIFLAAKVIGEIFERLKLPAVLGEILAGVVMGPYALGWIYPSDTLGAIAEIGAIFVLFVDRHVVGDRLESCRLRPASNSRRLGYRAQRGRRDDASRRSGPDCSSGGIEFADRVAIDICGCGFYDRCDDGACTAHAALFVREGRSSDLGLSALGFRV